MLGLGSATDLGLVLAAGGIPFALFALAGGVWADRVGRRRVMLASDIVRAVSQAATAVLLLTGTAEVWMLAVLAVVYGTAGRGLHARADRPDPADGAARRACRRPTRCWR